MKRSEFLATLGGIGFTSAIVHGGPTTSFRGARARTESTHELSFPPEAVFPLLCPVREYDWVEGWSCDMIFSQSGVAEENCIFQTSSPHGVSTWYVAHYDAPNRIEFIVVSPLMATRLDINLQRTAAGTRLTWTHIFTGLTEQGNAHINDRGVDRNRKLTEQLEYYLQTGKMLRSAAE
jgi:hypothetical protein